MATQAQIDANRRNCRSSTGPKSAEGKRVVANNALKHGLRREEAVIRGEDPEIFADFADQIRMNLEECDNSLQNVLLVERIIRLEWKLRRLPRLEKRAMDQLVGESEDGYAALLEGIIGDADHATLAKLHQYEMRLARELRACLRELNKGRQLKTTREVHQAWCDGYNRGVRVEADAKNRDVPLTPPQTLPDPRPLEAEIEDEPSDTETELAEQSQFAQNDRPVQELAMDEASSPSIALVPAGGDRSYPWHGRPARDVGTPTDRAAMTA